MGTKIDTLFTDTIELILWAGYTSRDQKLSVLSKASAKLDSLKFFLNLAWELKCLDHKKNATIAVPLAEVGKMLGKWIKYLKENSAENIGRA